MNFLTGIGGIGAGLMSAQQILQKQKESEQRAKGLELQQTEQQMRIDAANAAKAEKEDDKLFGKLQNDKVRTSGVAPESGTAGVTAGGEQDKALAAQMAGMGLTDTDKATYGVDAKGERYGDVQKHQAYAQRAAEKGDIDGEMKYSKYAKLLENEGVDQLWGDLEAGMSPQEAKARYDKTGSLKMGSGAFDYDPQTRSITLEMGGKPITVTRENYERMKLGILDRSKLTKTESDINKTGADIKKTEQDIEESKLLTPLKGKEITSRTAHNYAATKGMNVRTSGDQFDVNSKEEVLRLRKQYAAMTLEQRATPDGQKIASTLSAYNPDAKDKDYKIAVSEIAQVFSTPAVDPEGKPIIDMMTGQQRMNRNLAKEQEFFKYMKDRGITNSDKGLSEFMARDNAPATVRKKYNPVTGKIE